MTLREVTPAAGAGPDHGVVRAIAALEHDVFGVDAWSPAQVAEELDGPGRRTWVTEQGGAVVGYAVEDAERRIWIPEHGLEGNRGEFRPASGPVPRNPR